MPKIEMTVTVLQNKSGSFVDRETNNTIAYSQVLVMAGTEVLKFKCVKEVQVLDSWIGKPATLVFEVRPGKELLADFRVKQIVPQK